MIGRALRRIRSWLRAGERELRKQNSVLEAALDELVYLKDLKIRQGKTPEYAARQRLAWFAARQALGHKASGHLCPIRRIEINFPVPVALTQEDERHLDYIAGEICDRWRLANPDRVMWPAGHGSKVTYMPMTRAEELSGRHMEFDDDVYVIDCSERERYPTDHH